MTATHNPQAAADKAGAAYRDMRLTSSVTSVSTPPFRRACAP
jgi:hypothetical protein